MAVKLRKPILVAGLGLSAVLGLWDLLSESPLELGGMGVLSTIALGTSFWLWQRQQTSPSSIVTHWQPVTREEVESAIAVTESHLSILENETNPEIVSHFRQIISELPQQLERQQLQVVVTGGKNVGKTKLKQLLELEKLNIIDTEALFTGIESQNIEIQQNLVKADLVLFVTSEDITDSQWQMLQQLQRDRHRILLIFNKQDQYLPEDQILILQQLKQRVSAIFNDNQIIAISAAPAAIKVRQYQQDGSIKEWLEQKTPQIEPLRDRINAILGQETTQLVAATTYRQAINLQRQIKQELNQIRRKQAMPIIEQYQWIAAAATFASPVSALDLLATVAINAQMLVDLGKIYQQKFTISQAQAITSAIAKLMLQLGLVELSTQTITSFLKTNAITYLAGSVVQGVSAAYLTKVAGLSLIEYFQEQEINLKSENSLNLDKLSAKIKGVFEQNQTGSIFGDFVQQSLQKLPIATI